MKKLIIFCLLSTLLSFTVKSQLTSPTLVGYWHNWSDVSVPYLDLSQIDTRYNVIEISFAMPTSNTDMTMLFTPYSISQSDFILKVQALQAQEKKVLISIGGATTNIDLTTTVNKNAFISSMTNIINTYGFDGIDLDIEHGNSITLTGGTIQNPTDSAIINLISAVKQIMANYRTTHSKKLLLTMAPETCYVQGGMSAYASFWGGYLPIIHALRDSLDILQVQLYNSGSIYGIDSVAYNQGTADFIVAMTEAVIQGFNTSGGHFDGLPPSKVAVALPACSLAAGGGFIDTATVRHAINYLMGIGPKPGLYTLLNPTGYPTLRGMMTWSINWDVLSTCGGLYSFAENYERIFHPSMVSVNNYNEILKDNIVYPNPAANQIYISFTPEANSKYSFEIYDTKGNQIYSSIINNSLSVVNTEFLFNGIYLYQLKENGLPISSGKIIINK